MCVCVVQIKSRKLTHGLACDTTIDLCVCIVWIYLYACCVDLYVGHGRGGPMLVVLL